MKPTLPRKKFISQAVFTPPPKKEIYNVVCYGGGGAPVRKGRYSVKSYPIGNGDIITFGVGNKDEVFDDEESRRLQ